LSQFDPKYAPEKIKCEKAGEKKKNLVSKKDYPVQFKREPRNKETQTETS
jgi:hypothetical protein